MGSIHRCLVHGHRPERIVEPAKELVARGAEVLAVGNTAAVLKRAGVPVAEIPAFTATSSAPHEAFQLLHPRVHGGLLGDWEDADQRAELERQGVKRIDLVIVELPDPEAGQVGPDLLRQLDVGGVAVLRSAARNPDQVISICDLADLPAVLRALEHEAGQPDQGLRLHLARKALQAVARHDAVLAALSVPAGEVPDSWSIQAQRIEELPVAGGGGRAGLFASSADARSGPGLRSLAGPAPTFQCLLDAELVWSAIEAQPAAAVAIGHHGSLCGFSLAADSLAAAYVRARATDPRGSFGAVVGVNRELDAACAGEVGAGLFDAVLAPGFSAEARAALGRGKIRLLQVSPGTGPAVACRTTRWGLVLQWPHLRREASPGFRTLSARKPDDAEQAGLELAWRLARWMPPVAVVITDRRQLLAAGVAQTSWRDAARVAVMKMPAGAGASVAACVHPIRFADDVAVLSSAGVSAILQPAGSPRQSEVVERIDRLGLALQVVDDEEGV